MSGFDETSGRHALDVKNFFHTDPYRVANWARLAGLTDVRLRADYLHDENYERSSGDGKVMLVAHRPESAHAAHRRRAQDCHNDIVKLAHSGDGEAR